MKSPIKMYEKRLKISPFYLSSLTFPGELPLIVPLLYV